MAPVLRQQIAAGHKLRLLYLLGPQLRELDGDAAQEEFKFAARHACGCRELCHALWTKLSTGQHLRDQQTVMATRLVAVGVQRVQRSREGAPARRGHARAQGR